LCSHSFSQKDESRPENSKYVSLFEANTGQLYPSGSHANGGITLRFELPKVMHDKINKILAEF